MLVDEISISLVVPIHRIPSDLDSILCWIPSLPSDFQIIIVHDFKESPLSTSQKEKILSSHRNSDLVEGKFNGPGGARNVGIEHMRGKFVAFWDSDDSPVVENVIEMKELLNKLEADCIIGGYFKRNSATGITTQVIPQQNNWIFETSIEPGLWRFLIRRDIMHGIRFPTIYMGEDQVFLARLNGQVKKYQIYQKPVYVYNTHNPEQLTSKPVIVQEIYVAIRMMLQAIDENTSDDNRLPIFMSWKMLLSCVKTFKFGKAQNFLKIYLEVFRKNSKIKTSLFDKVMFIKSLVIYGSKFR